MRSSLLFALLCSLLFLGCRDDIEDFTVTTTTNAPPSIFVEAKITGLVLLPSGRPAANATVASPGIGTTTTNANGRFSFPFGSLDANGHHLFISIDNEFVARRIIMPSAGSTMYEVITLGQFYSGQFMANEDASIELENGVRLNVAAGAARSGANSYEGEVIVTANYMAPDNFEHMLNSPGNALAFHDGEFATLESYGMIDISFRTPEGGVITFSDESPAELMLPLSQEVAAEAPDSIDFWRIEELNWMSLVQRANLQEIFYVVPITTSGIYNCDIPHESTRFCGQLLDMNDIPLPHQVFALRVVGGQFVNVARTDDQGRFCAWGPRNVATELVVIDQCSNEETVVDLGTANDIFEDVGAINIDISTTLIPVSIENCANGLSIDNETIGIYINGYYTHKYYFPVQDNLSAILNFPDCGNQQTVNIQAISLDKRQASQIVQRNVNDDSALNLTVCDLADSDENITLSIDGEAAEIDKIVTLLERNELTGVYNYQVLLEGTYQGSILKMNFVFDEAAVGSYPGSPTSANISLVSPTSMEVTQFYRIEDNETFTVNISQVSPMQNSLQGNFSYNARVFDAILQSDVGFDIPIEGNFSLNL